MKSFLTQIKTELKLHFREPEAVFWGFIFPVLMIVVLGFIFSENEDDALAQTIYIEKKTPHSAAVYAALEAQEDLRLAPLSRDSLMGKIESGDLDFGVFVKQGEDSTFAVEFVYASIASNQRTLVAPKLEAALAAANYSAMKQTPKFRLTTSEITVEAASGDSVGYVAWLVPGVLALNLFLSCVFGIGISVVMDKRQGKLKKIATTPLAKWKFMLTLSVQRMMVLFFQVIVIVVAGWLIFDVHVVGSFAELLLAVVVSMLSFMMFGFAIAAISKTIEKAVALSNLFFISSLLLSGAYFSNAGLPKWIAVFADALPVTLSVNLVRGIYAYGESMFSQPLLIGGLLAWVVVSLGLSVKLFSWYDD